MVNFNKIIGLAGLATVFAGMAFGQATCAVAGGAATTNIIRAEGTTEQVASVTFSCTTAAPILAGGAATVQVFISPSLPVTSKVLSTSGATAGQTEAIVSINGAAAVNGVASGSAVSFSGVPLPATVVCGATNCYNFVISNIRVNATSLSLGSGVPPNVTETIFVSGSAANINPAALNAVTVAFAQNGLGTTKLYKGFTTGIVNALNANAANFPNGTVGTSTGANNYPVCANYSPAADKIAFATGNVAAKSLMTVVQINENFASAFKQVAVAAAYNTGEQSQVATAIGGTTNQVFDGTRLQLNVSNVPTGVTLYVPTGMIGSQVGAGIIQLTASGPGTAFANVAPSTATGVINTSSFSFNANFGVAPIPVTAGSGSAVFEVTTQDLTNIDSYNVPVFIVFTSNPAVGTSTPISLSVSFNPIGSTAIPNFAVGTSTVTLNGGTFSLCSTNLLFPFVTNQLGFDTGLAISNTSSDPYGSTYGATSQAGTCTINFYGANAPTPASVTTPSVASGSTYTTVVSGLAPNFQGYIIVQCQFQYGHGFGFVTNAGSAGPAAIAQGYTAAVIPDPVTNGGRAASPNGLAAANTGENLGQ